MELRTTLNSVVLFLVKQKIGKLYFIYERNKTISHK